MSSSEADVIIRNDRDKFDHSTVSKGEHDEMTHIDHHTSLLSCSVSDSERDKFQIFEQWLLENGAKMPKLELRVR